MAKIRSSQQDWAYRIGRGARIRGLDVKAANVELARRLGWTTRADFDNDLLDECERGWHAQDELMEDGGLPDLLEDEARREIDL